MSRERVHRLRCREALRVLRNQRRQQRLSVSAKGIERRRAMRPNDVWCWDFVEHRDHRGRPLRWLTLVDESTRECLLLEVERSMSGERVRELLAEAIRLRGVPGHGLSGARSDNGSEFIAKRLRQFLKATQIETLYIEPGSPWQNGYGERR